ncbi:MAG: hypothetical protein AB203_02600 [Parcubacteria bacterium C7867-008]|nr:MAG: hypothetical protein AB203_02600 [Parcubacteria bacterium C7867-008]
MAQAEGGAKRQLTVRLKPANRAGLDQLAERGNGNISALVDQAVEEFLARRSGTPIAAQGPFALDSADIERIAPVVKAIGAPISLQVFTDIIEAQRTQSKA